MKARTTTGGKEAKGPSTRTLAPRSYWGQAVGGSSGSRTHDTPVFKAPELSSEYVKSSAELASVVVEGNVGSELASSAAGHVFVDGAASQSVSGHGRIKGLLATLRQSGLNEATWHKDDTNFQFGADGASQAFPRVQVPGTAEVQDDIFGDYLTDQATTNWFGCVGEEASIPSERVDSRKHENGLVLDDWSDPEKRTQQLTTTDLFRKNIKYILADSSSSATRGVS